MNSNIVTEKLENIYNYDFDDNEAFKKVINKQLNLVNYFNDLVKNFQMLECALDIISINDFINNEKKLELAVESSDENIKEELTNFSSIAYPALKNAFLEKKDEIGSVTIKGKNIFEYSFNEACELRQSIIKELDYVLSEMEEFVPSYLKEAISNAIRNNEDFGEAALNSIQNNLTLFSFSVNVAKNSFADIFMQRVVEKLIATNDLDCIDELYNKERDPQCIAILLEVMREAQADFTPDEVINLIDFDENLYNRAFELFYENIKTDIQDPNGIFMSISKLLDRQVSGLYEFSKSFYEKYGNLIVMPLADMLRNNFIKADNDLKAYMESVKKDIDPFLIDIPKRICDNYYLNYNYSSAKQIDNKIKEI